MRENFAYITFNVSVLLLAAVDLSCLFVLTVLCKPGMLEDLINGETAVRILHKAPCYKGLSFLANQLPARQIKH